MTLVKIPKNIKIEYDKNTEKLLQKAGTYLSKNIERKLKDKVLFLSSGGSALSILDYIDEKSLTENLTVGIVDERFTQNVDGQNAQKFEKTNFYKKTKLRKVNFLNLESQESRILKSFGDVFDKNLKKWKKDYPNGFVIITLGIGEDSHIAGIMPSINVKRFKKIFENDNSWALGYNSKSNIEYPKRITVTPIFLTDVVDSVVVYVVGMKKKEVLARLLSKNGEIFETPARIILEMSNVKIFTDRKL